MAFSFIFALYSSEMLSAC